MKSSSSSSQNETVAVATPVRTTHNGLQIFDVNVPLPDLDKANALPLDLMADYWTPEMKGDSKRLFFDRIDSRQVLDQTTGESMNLECAFFIYKADNGEIKSISNGSKRLVGALQASNIQRGTPLLITYLGKKKNSTNSFQSDNWSIKPLIVNI